MANEWKNFNSVMKGNPNVGPVSVDVVRTELLSMPGILAVSYLRNAEGQIDRVNVIAQADHKSPGQVAQDVTSYLKVRCHLPLDAGRVDVVLWSDAEWISSHPRPRLLSLQTRYGLDGTEISVTLGLRDGQFTGEAAILSGWENPRHVIGATSKATLRAAEQVLSGRCEFSLIDARSVELGGGNVLVVAVTMFPEFGSGILVGSCRVRGDWIDAAAKATLDAINRTFIF